MKVDKIKNGVMQQRCKVQGARLTLRRLIAMGVLQYKTGAVSGKKVLAVYLEPCTVNRVCHA
jgi:hypothetical protein